MRTLAGFALGLIVGVGVAERLSSGLVEAQHETLVAYRAALDQRDDDLEVAMGAVLRAEALVEACRTPLAPGAIVPFELTAYSLGCDAPGPATKAGTTPVAGHTVAADPRVLPLGSIVRIAGIGERQVHDVGGAVKGRVLDVYVDDCEQAREWGREVRQVEVLHLAGSR
jgi:3D (Asp-Asp-Asp) domain-containing protein